MALVPTAKVAGSSMLGNQWKELFAIVAAALTWKHQWHGKQVKFMCDNHAIVPAWQGQCSSDSHIMNLMRTLCHTAPVHHPKGQQHS